MSILFVLLTFLVIVAINYFHSRNPQEMVLSDSPVVFPVKTPVMTKEFEFLIPKGFGFHPGHAWAMKEQGENVRVGLDSFAADLIGPIEKIEVASPSRWIRQGQRLMTIHANGGSFDVVSPVEGVVMAVNNDAVQDPSRVTRDPYQEGWVAMLKSPDFGTNQKNLMQGAMVAPWMHYSVARLNESIAKQNPALAQDGGVPLKGILQRLQPELRQKLIKEFFLS
jgi:glycine cleavage system H lipoate-binding protein